eukprot:SAG22_NODE_5309_length_1040_cov_0.801275_4_plen_45_part_01
MVKTTSGSAAASHAPRPRLDGKEVGRELLHAPLAYDAREDLAVHL